MNINEHQDQRYTRGDNNGRDLYLLGVNVLVYTLPRVRLQFSIVIKSVLGKSKGLR